MKLARVLIFALWVARLASNGAAVEPALDRAALYASWTGQWKGVLEYRDYRPLHGRVSLPTTLTVKPAPGATALILHFVYDDGLKKTVNSIARLEFDPAARRSLCHRRPPRLLRRSHGRQ